ncbi:MAG: metal ABC transporter ATP-binding protein [Saprospiraceae bacterium]|nr:metal ABC transporter ATP-binding protein [Saprospiraceae bacterium]
MSNSNPVLEVHDLTVSYNKKPVLWGVDFSIDQGNLVGIIGPNGAGKSTLIKSIMGLVDKSAGFSKVFGRDLKQVRNKISYVPQRGSVDWDFPATVFDVVLMGTYGKLGLFKRPKRAHKEAANNAIKSVGLQGLEDRQIAQLSGGQQQRVFLARALAQNAELYFMDEPFAGVDAATEKTIIEILKNLKNQGKTVLVVHHDLQTVSEYFDQVILLNTRLVAFGDTDKTFTENNLQETYGGKLTLLSEIRNLMAKEEMPSREK